MRCHITARICCVLFTAGCFLQGCNGFNDGNVSEKSVGDDMNFRVETYAGPTDNEVYVEEVWPKTEKGDTSGGVTEKCMKYLRAFSNSTTLFLQCAMTNARPLHYCENCIAEFSSVNKAYDAIADDEIKNGTTCQDELLRADDVQVVLLAYDFVQDVWDKSTCHNCYYAEEKNGTTFYHATKETLEMLDKIQHTQECFHDFGTGEGEPLNISVCTACQKFYSDANIFYNDLDEENKLCSDLVDSMNYTRRMWSTDYKCTVVDKNDVIIFGIAFTFGSLPLIFYVGVWVFNSHQEKKERLRTTASMEVRASLTEPPREI